MNTSATLILLRFHVVPSGSFFHQSRKKQKKKQRKFARALDAASLFSRAPRNSTSKTLYTNYDAEANIIVVSCREVRWKEESNCATAEKHDRWKNTIITTTKKRKNDSACAQASSETRDAEVVGDNSKHSDIVRTRRGHGPREPFQKSFVSSKARGRPKKLRRVLHQRHRKTSEGRGRQGVRWLQQVGRILPQLRETKTPFGKREHKAQSHNAIWVGQPMSFAPLLHQMNRRSAIAREARVERVSGDDNQIHGNYTCRHIPHRFQPALGDNITDYGSSRFWATFSYRQYVKHGTVLFFLWLVFATCLDQWD